MNQPADRPIRMFEAGTRLGRLRYFLYSCVVGVLMVLPAMLVGAALAGFSHPILGGLVVLAAYVFLCGMHFVFATRRLHDMGRSGWWALIIALVLAFGFLEGLHLLPTAGLKLYRFVLVADLVFTLVLLFAPGTAGENRYGAPPPSNGRGVYAAVWGIVVLDICAALIVVSIIPFLGEAYGHEQVAALVSAARSAEYPAMRYRRENGRWPVDITSVAGNAAHAPLVGSLTSISYLNDGYGIVARTREEGGKAVEVWTLDGGATWHCGPDDNAPPDRTDLPADCTEEAPPS